MSGASDNAARAAWREPMVWLVWGLPALVVVASVATLLIALHAGGADAVPVEVRRTAQIQVEDLHADREALRRALRGELQRQPDTGALQVRLQSPLLPDEARLYLRLLHPGDAARDRVLTLVRAGDLWLGRLPDERGHTWNLELMPEDGAWRLAGRLGSDATGAVLRPRLAE